MIFPRYIEPKNVPNICATTFVWMHSNTDAVTQIQRFIWINYVSRADGERDANENGMQPQHINTIHTHTANAQNVQNLTLTHQIMI